MPQVKVEHVPGNAGNGHQPFGRISSIDALRGLAVSLCVIAAVLVPFLLTLPVSPVTRLLVDQLSHSVWHGVTLMDLVQPLFLVIMGAAVVLSHISRTSQGQSRWQILRHALLRAVVLFAVGLLINVWIENAANGLRLGGPLQQIAVCYLIVAVLVPITNWQIELGAVVLLLANYGFLLELFPMTDDQQTTYSINHNLCALMDVAWLPGRKYFGTWDPYGLVTLMPALALTFAGMILGRLLMTSRFSRRQKQFGLFLSGFLLINNGFLLGRSIPINSYLATVPFVMIALGAVLVAQVVFLSLAGGELVAAWAAPFVAIGRNSLIVITALRLLPPASRIQGLLAGGINDWLGNVSGLVVALLQFAVLGGIIWWLSRKRWFLTV